MKLKDDLGVAARVLYVLFGLILAGATLATAWSEWPGVISGKESPLGFGLIMMFVVPLALFIIVWACVGRHREWRIADDHVRIRLLSLTTWQKDLRIKAEDIESVSRDQYNYDDDSGRVAHALTLNLKGGKSLRSPKVFDGAQIDRAVQHLERLRQTNALSGGQA